MTGAHDVGAHHGSVSADDAGVLAAPTASVPASQLTTRRAVSGHNRPRLRRSIRVQIMVPVIVAALGVAFLGATQIREATDAAASADRASVLARGAQAIGRLVHSVAAEYVQTNEARRSGRGDRLLVELQRQTDDAKEAFADAAVGLGAAAPDLVTLIDAATRATTTLDYARARARGEDAGIVELRAYYDQVLTSLVTLLGALPPQLGETGLIEVATSMAQVAELERLAVLQLDLITEGLTEGSLSGSDLLLLSQWIGAERSRVQTLSNRSPAGARYANLAARTSVRLAESIRQAILDSHGENLATEPAVWFEAQSQRVQALWDLEQGLSVLLIHEAAAAGDAARRQAYLVGSLSAAVVAVTLIAATLLAVRTSRRLRRTRYAALTAARIELPTAIARVSAARDAETVRTALNQSAAQVESMLTKGEDEIGELANAFGAVHRQALRLAAEQALLRMEVQALFIALSRRGQTLVQRQIHLIDEFSRNETDPQALSRLFALDHLAARMRRNEENLLVLAGGEPGRWITRPVAIVDLARAAAQEIEAYRRVTVEETPRAAVAAAAAGDIIHLLAELLENATSFSPPETVVRVAARRGPDGLVITISDQGIGMTPAQLEEANGRLAQPSALTSRLVGTMGLLVVARLAQRHGITVRLDSAPAQGTTATVVVPDRLVVPITPQDEHPADRRPRALEHYASPQGPPQGPPQASPEHASPKYAAPQPAATSLPPVATPTPSTSMTPVTGSIPQPRSPARPESLPTTAAGLPRRPKHSDAGGDVATSAGATGAAPPDPDTVRARLSSLANGLAAAKALAVPAAEMTEPSDTR